MFSNWGCKKHNHQINYIKCSRCENYICANCNQPVSSVYKCPECVSILASVIPRISKVRFFSNQSYNQATKFLTICLISIYGTQLFLGSVVISNFTLFALSVTNGQWWLLITSGFLHGSIIHLLCNVYILWVIGSQLENIVGKIKFITIYFVSLLGGSLASYLFSPFGSYSIGASGAIFGLMGAMLVVGRKHNLDISQITTLVVINVVIGFALSGIDWRAHLGGLAAGALITWVLINATSLKGKNQQ